MYTQVSQLADLRLLIVDDDAVSAEVARLHLEEAGATITICEDGQQAISLAMASVTDGPPYDAILMNMLMPLVNGYDATRRLRKRGYTGVVIAFTASDDCRGTLASGCDDYIQKPVNGTELVRRIHNAIAASKDR